MGLIIGMDPHKRSATIEIVDERAEVLVTCRFGTDKAGYAQMLAMGRKFADRIWAVEGCNGIGEHIAHRIVHDGEIVLDVPAKLSAQVRVFASGVVLDEAERAQLIRWANACGWRPAAAVPGRAARPRTGHEPGAWRRCCAGAC